MKLEAFSAMSEFLLAEGAETEEERSFVMLETLLYSTYMAVTSGNLHKVRLGVSLSYLVD